MCELLEVRSSNEIQSSSCNKKWMGKILVSWYLQCSICLPVLPSKTTFTLTHMETCATDFGESLTDNRKREGATQHMPFGMQKHKDLLHMIDLCARCCLNHSPATPHVLPGALVSSVLCESETEAHSHQKAEPWFKVGHLRYRSSFLGKL